MRSARVVRRTGAVWAAAVVAVVWTVGWGAVARAQDAAITGTAKQQMMAKDANPGWEVVTVRPSDPDYKNDGFDVRGRRVVIENQTVEIMLMAAYSLQKSQIVGGPEWVRTERFMAEGVPDLDGTPDLRQFQGMIRKLLEERFGLKMHQEKREMPVFALTVARGGPKMTKSTSDPNGLPRDNGNGGVIRTHKFRNTSMADLTLLMLLEVNRPIVDQTGLQGKYDFDLKFSKDEAGTNDPNAPPGLFTAIQEQVGLKLEPVRAPADVLVIDKVDRPGAN